MKTLTEKQKETMETIYKANIHKAITVKAVQQLSFKGNKSAWDIRNSGYTDPITEELYSNTMLEITEAVVNDICTIDDNNKLIFSDSDENGNSETFLNIFRSIRRYLDGRRQEEKKWLYISEYDENGNETETYSIMDKKALSERSNIDHINEMDVIKTVRENLKDKDSIILDDLLNGLSYRDIASKNNLTKKAVECAVNRIRKAYPKTEIKRLSEVKSNWKDTTKHDYIYIDTNIVSKCTPTIIGEPIKKHILINNITNIETPVYTNNVTSIKNSNLTNCTYKKRKAIKTSYISHNIKLK